MKNRDDLEITQPAFPIPKEDARTLIEDFILKSDQLALLKEENSKTFTILQMSDKKKLSFQEKDVDRVLERKRDNQDDFLQINFKNGKKILLTKDYIGFAPAKSLHVDFTRFPKVVTTADLFSMIESIENTLYNSADCKESLAEVHNFFEVIASGAESVGFDVSSERVWIEKLISNKLAMFG